MNDYETRYFHEVTHYHEVIYIDGKPVAILLNETDFNDMYFLMPTDKIKTTKIKLK